MRRDPEDHELTSLLRHAAVEGRRVLDVGCGDGEFTYRYGAAAGMVAAVDPSLPELREAVGGRPGDLGDHLHFTAARGQALPFPTGHFDLAFFTSSF